MDWESVWKIVLSIVLSVGGAGAIISGVVKFSADKISEHLSEKYKHELSKQMEQYKVVLEKRSYVSKARFDTEFSLYKEIMQASKKMVDAVYLIYPTYASVPADKEDRKKYEEEVYTKAAESYNTFIELLSGNAPFISEVIYNELFALGKLCRENIAVYEFRWNKGYMGNWEHSADKREEEKNAYKRTKEFSDKYDSIVKQLRQYFAELDIRD